MRLIFLLSVVFSVAECRTCNCAQHSSHVSNGTDESVEWFNDFLVNLYEINSDSIWQMLVDTVDTKVADVLPGFIKSLTLEHFNLKDIPGIDLVTHSVTDVTCDDARFKRYTVDFDISVDNPGVLAAFRTVLVLGISAGITLEEVQLNGILRVEILMSSELNFPAIQNMKITFLDRPKVEFEVELGDTIGMGAFGIEDWLHNLVEDALQEKLVYPGMFFMDMSGVNTTTAMIDNNPNLHPAVLSANITVTPINVTQPRTSLEGWVDFGDDETRKVMLASGLANHQFDIFLENFRYSEARVRVIERSIITDSTWFDLIVEIPTELRSDSLKTTHTKVYTDGRSSWNVTVDIWTMLLPPIETITRDGVPTLVPSLYTQTNCSAGDNGVLYIKLHGAANLTLGDHDSDMDPYVYIMLDGKKVGETERKRENKNPDYKYEFETLLRSTGKRLSDHVIEFVVYDWDRWSSDDLVGKARVVVDPSLRVNEEITVFKYAKDVGKLYVTILFRPVPFF